MTNLADPSKLKRRTLKSLVVFFLLATAAAYTFYRVQDADYVDDTQAPYRQVLEFNGRIWKNLFNVNRLNTCQPPVAGKAPRVNGDIGMDKPVDIEHWSMTVVADADVADSPRMQVTLHDLQALDRTESASQFRCIEGWSEDISYSGVKFSDFMKAYNLQRKAYVGLVTEDGEYYVSIDIESMMHPQTLLAFEMNGRPLKPENGAPLRLVIPVKYGIKSLKRIGKIFFSDQRPPDYWAERGYDWYAGL